MSDETDRSAKPTTDVRRKHPSKRTIVIRCVAAFYVPYGWLLFVESLWPWNAPQWTWTQVGITPWTWTSYHWQWIKLWPILPGLVPTTVFNAWTGIGRPGDWIEFMIGGLVSAAIIAGVAWAASRGGRWTTTTLAATFLTSCVCSWLAYQLYAW